MASKGNDSTTFKEKLEFFWKYNKIHVFIWAIGLIILGVFLYQKITTPVLIFHGMFLNASDQEKYQKKAIQGDIPKRHVPLKIPCAASPSDTRKCSDFRVSSLKKLEDFEQ